MARSELGWQCHIVSRNPAGTSDGVGLIQYELKGGATEKTHYCTRSFENAVAHSQGVFEACRQHKELRPDLVVNHRRLRLDLVLAGTLLSKFLFTGTFPPGQLARLLSLSDR